MKIFITFVLTLCLGVVVRAQNSTTSEEPEEQLFVQSPEELEDLVGAIALYPDALIALILPASTSPSEIVLAARFLDRNEDPDTIDQQQWTDSVRGLARYPDVIKQMNEDLEWSIRLGEAFMSQPADVMEAIQRLRERAQANGSLQTTPEQTVVTKEDRILIVPTRPDVIYVPTYDTRVVYVDRPVYYHRPFITFGFGYHVGAWLTYDCDWYGGSIWWVDNRRYWNYHRDWRYPRFPRQVGYVDYRWRRPWTPPRDHYRPRRSHVDPRPRVVDRPQPRPNRDRQDPRWADRDRNDRRDYRNRNFDGGNNRDIRYRHHTPERTNQPDHTVVRTKPRVRPRTSLPAVPNKRPTPPQTERNSRPRVSPAPRVVRTSPPPTPGPRIVHTDMPRTNTRVAPTAPSRRIDPSPSSRRARSESTHRSAPSQSRPREAPVHTERESRQQSDNNNSYHSGRRKGGDRSGRSRSG